MVSIYLIDWGISAQIKEVYRYLIQVKHGGRPPNLAPLFMIFWMPKGPKPTNCTST